MNDMTDEHCLERMKQPLMRWEVIQLHPARTRNRMFAGCLAVVDEAKPWGCLCYVTGLGKDGREGGQAYYRAEWEEIMKLDALHRAPAIPDPGDAA
jgi:hypothetical protein